LSVIRTLLSFRAPLALLLTTALLALGGQVAAAVASPVINLSANRVVLPVGSKSTLTATLSPVQHTGIIEIFEPQTGTWLNSCFPDIVCHIDVTRSTPAIVQYQAFWTSHDDHNLGTIDILASSSVVKVVWGTVSLGPPSGSPVPVGTGVTLTATTSFDVGPTPDYIKLFDLTTGTLVTGADGVVVKCPFGTSCTFHVSQPTPGTHRYAALVAVLDDRLPPLFDLSSNNQSVQWA